MSGRDITQYWKLKTAKGEIKRGPDSLRAHSAGAMLRHARRGDRLWILTNNKGRLCLVQHFVITDAGLSQKRAAELRGVDPAEIWEADCHVLGPANWTLPTELIDIHKVAKKLRFVSAKHQALRLDGGKLDSQTLRSLRVLTPESADILVDYWQSHTKDSVQPVPATEFNPKNLRDARRRILASIAVRQGQAGFREALLDAYDRRCAITGADATETLEAAHIVPYLGVKTSVVSNGLLLRGDVHTLFDLGLIAVDTKTMTVRIASSLRKTSYRTLDGKRIRAPRDSAKRPSVAALNAHIKNSRLRHE